MDGNISADDAPVATPVRVTDGPLIINSFEAPSHARENGDGADVGIPDGTPFYTLPDAETTHLAFLSEPENVS